MPASQHKPRLSFWQIWNMCFGFFGIQFAFALQNGSMSRIFQTLGAEMDDLAVLWIAAPMTGLLVQPIIGYYSDRTWTRLGRRRPYFLVGAILTTLALFVMPNSSVLWFAAVMLWLLDASINVSMEPFRAFVGDQLPPEQRTRGYAMQSFFIGAGAVVAYLLPEILSRLGVANTAALGEIPPSVRLSFYIGGAVLICAMGWTILRTREYPPEQLQGFDDAGSTALAALAPSSNARLSTEVAVFAVPAAILAVCIRYYALDKSLYLLAVGLAAYALLLLVTGGGRRGGGLGEIIQDMRNMPATMRQLAVVQFFSWFALFAMWIYTTPTVTSLHFHSTDTTSAAYNDGADWVGVLFAAYSAFSALAAFGLAPLSRRIGLRATHLTCLVIGGLSFLSFRFIADPHLLLLPMAGIGVAWAAILAIPYSLLSGAVPARKMGVYMGIFNFFIVIPQLVAASLLGFLVKTFFNNQPVDALMIGGVSLVIAGLCVLRVQKETVA
ncbi:MFS transporter [Pseudoxanthomonas gei]|uniref:MFS transporter n=2 Tax=Pseudoxanthomonas gei TaxID=1383030 RepID=A0ABX0A7Y0_9GAMM|nr:MFS transporter [Pseudoxanthomonas gei]